MPAIQPPDGLTWLHLGTFSRANLAVDSLHFGVDFNLLLSFLGGRPYLNGAEWSHSGCILFVLGLSIGMINACIGQYAEAPSKWDNSLLGILDLDALNDHCVDFCVEFHKVQALQKVAESVPPYVPTVVSVPVPEPLDLASSK